MVIRKGQLTKQLEDLKLHYADQITSQILQKRDQINKTFPTENEEKVYRNTYEQCIKDVLPKDSVIRWEGISWERCGKNYMINLAIFLKEEDLQHSNIPKRAIEYQKIEDAKNKKLQELNNWHTKSLENIVLNREQTLFDPTL